MESAELLADPLRDNEVPRELLLESRQLVIPKTPAPTRSQRHHVVARVLDRLLPRSADLLPVPSRGAPQVSPPDHVRTHSSFPSADVWHRYDRGFRYKAACSPVPLDWGANTIRPTPAATCSSRLRLPYRPFVFRPFVFPTALRPSIGRSLRLPLDQDPRSAVRGTMGVVPAASLNANDVTNAPGVMTHIAVLTAPPLPSFTLSLLFAPGPRPTLAIFPSSIAPRSTPSPPFSVSSPSSSAFLNSTVIAPPLLVSSSPASYTASPLSANSTSPSPPCSCAFGASSSFNCSHLSAQYLCLNVRAEGPPIHLLSSVPPVRFPPLL